MLKGHVFLYQIFGNEIAAKLFNTLSFSKNGIFKDFEDEMEVTYNGTEVTVSSGVALIGGRPVQETSSTTIDAGTTSLYCKLCLTVDLDQENTTSQLNQAYYEIVTDVSDYPVLTQDDIVNNNSGKYQFELAQFTTGVSGIDDFVDSRTYINLEEISGVPTNAVMGFDGNTIPSGYEEIVAVESGTLTSTSANATLNNCSYFKWGRIVQITGSVVITNGTSATWKTYDLVTLPEKLYPLQSTVTSAIRDEDSKIIGVGIATARNALYIADRGRGSLTTNANVIPFNLVYVSQT